MTKMERLSITLPSALADHVRAVAKLNGGVSFSEALRFIITTDRNAGPSTSAPSAPSTQSKSPVAVRPSPSVVTTVVTDKKGRPTFGVEDMVYFEGEHDPEDGTALYMLRWQLGLAWEAAKAGTPSVYLTEFRDRLRKSGKPFEPDEIAQIERYHRSTNVLA